jgi:Flp pilus assembly pilin Flp
MLRRRLHEDERGIALIYALLAVVILAGLAVVFVSRAVNQAAFTGIGRDREAAVHVAEAGAEAYIAPINREGRSLAQRVLTHGDTPTAWPQPADAVNDDWIVYDPAVIDTEDKEIAWVLDLARANHSLIRSTNAGDTFTVRPVLADESDAAMVLFSAGFVPSYQAWIDGQSRPQVRVLKLQIARNHIMPDHALLLGGDLTIGGNASILAPGCDPADPDTCDADIHVNGDVDVTGGAHTVQGEVTSSGTITGTVQTEPAGNAHAGEEPEPLPPVEARDFYGRDADDLNEDPGGQEMGAFDLCPSGEIKEPAGAPCTGTVLWPTSSASSTTYRGWKFKSGTNTWEATNVEAGFFYVYRADASVTGTAGSDPRAVTIVVETDDANPNRTGSLALGGNPDMVSAMPDVLFVADRDIKMKGTSGGGSNTCDPSTSTCDTQRYNGFIWATEQLDVSGTVYLTGAIIAADETDQHGLVTRNTAGVTGNMTLDYDRDLIIDASGRVIIQYWNELD